MSIFSKNNKIYKKKYLSNTNKSITRKTSRRQLTGGIKYRHAAHKPPNRSVLRVASHHSRLKPIKLHRARQENILNKTRPYYAKGHSISRIKTSRPYLDSFSSLSSLSLSPSLNIPNNTRDDISMEDYVDPINKFTENLNTKKIIPFEVINTDYIRKFNNMKTQS